MTNEIQELLTNNVSLTTHITPEQVRYDFKQWAGVISMMFTAVYTAVHAAFPKVQAFIDTRDGGMLQAMFFAIFGKPKAAELTPGPIVNKPVGNPAQP